MTPHVKGTVILALMAAPFLVFFCAMVMMQVAAFRQLMQDRLALRQSLFGSYILDKFYRRYSLVCADTLAVNIGIALIVIILALTGRLSL